MNFPWFYNLSATAIRSLTLAAKFLLVLALVKYFHTSDLGLYGILSACVAYALFFIGVEYFNYTSRVLIGASDTEQALIIRDQFLLYLIALLILTPFFFGVFYSNLLPVSLCLWFLFIVIFEHTSNEIMRILIALARPYTANVIYFIRQGLWIYLLLPIFYFFPESRQFNIILLAWILGAALSTLIGFITLYHLDWSNMWTHPIRWSLMLTGLRTCKPFLISAFCALSLLYMERFFITYYCGIEIIGIYTFYAGLSITLHTLVNTSVSRMRLSQLLSAWKLNDHKQFYLESRYMLKYTIIFVLIFSTISLVLVHPFVNILNKPIYLGYITIFYVLLLAAAFRSIADVPLYTLYAQHEDKLILKINLASFFIMMLGNVIFVPQFGPIGAAFASAAASFILLSYALFIMIQKTRSTIGVIDSPQF